VSVNPRKRADCYNELSVEFSDSVDILDSSRLTVFAVIEYVTEANTSVFSL
jgi:hypothetical protein